MSAKKSSAKKASKTASDAKADAAPATVDLFSGDAIAGETPTEDALKTEGAGADSDSKSKVSVGAADTAPSPNEAAPADESATEAAREAELAAAKSELREVALARRQNLRPAVRSGRSREICDKLLGALQESGFKSRDGHIPTVAVYAALRFEVDLDRFIRSAYALGYRIVFPCRVPKDIAPDAMCMRSVSCLNYIGGKVPFILDPKKPWGPTVSEEQVITANTPTGSRRRFIPSRVKGSVPPKDDPRFPVVVPRDIDFVVVPSVGFDAAGGRLGYGKGTYDRYLPQLREDCRVVGVAFSEQELENIPQSALDVRIPEYITA